jgi:hypothetical protein
MDDSPLTLLIVLAASALAVGGLIVLNRFIGGWQDVEFTDPALPAQRMEEDVTGFEAGEAVLARDRKAALVMEKDEARLGLVIARGDRCVTRAIRPGEIARLDADGARFHIHFNDFTLPRVTLDLEDSDAQGWEKMMRRFVKDAAASKGEGHAAAS